MNKVILTGRMVADPEVRYTQGSEPMAIARFRLAVNRRFQREGEPGADFISCVAFGKSAEFIEKYFRKGMKIDVSGRIQTGQYTNKDGQTVYTTEVVIEEQEFGESKQQNNSSSNSSSTSNSGFISVPDGVDEDLPFM